MKLEYDPYVWGVVEHMKQLGIKAVLFDLDDTLVYTSDVFDIWMDAYSEVVASKLNLSSGEVRKKLSKFNTEEYRANGVTPENWVRVVEKMKNEYGDVTGVTVEELRLLKNIYTTEPRVKKGIVSVLQSLERGGFYLGVVTHAEDEWTDYKLETTGLEHFFDVVKVVGVNKSKGAEDYLRAIEMLNLPPSEVLVVGDNLRGDVVAGDSLGARTVLLTSPWSVYREGDVPEKTVQIVDTDQLLEAFMALR